MATPNLYEDNKGKVTKESGSKLYTYNDDGDGIKDAGTDIENIIANGGFTIKEELPHYINYIRHTFLGNGISDDGEEIEYYFRDFNTDELVTYIIVGDDLVITEPGGDS